jgi:hypothetical protein
VPKSNLPLNLRISSSNGRLQLRGDSSPRQCAGATARQGRSTVKSQTGAAHRPAHIVQCTASQVPQDEAGYVYFWCQDAMQLLTCIGLVLMAGFIRVQELFKQVAPPGSKHMTLLQFQQAAPKLGLNDQSAALQQVRGSPPSATKAAQCAPCLQQPAASTCCLCCSAFTDLPGCSGAEPVRHWLGGACSGGWGGCHESVRTSPSPGVQTD